MYGRSRSVGSPVDEPVVSCHEGIDDVISIDGSSIFKALGMFAYNSGALAVGCAKAPGEGRRMFRRIARCSRVEFFRVCSGCKPLRSAALRDGNSAGRYRVWEMYAHVWTCRSKTQMLLCTAVHIAFSYSLHLSISAKNLYTCTSTNYMCENVR